MRKSQHDTARHQLKLTIAKPATKFQNKLEQNLLCDEENIYEQNRIAIQAFF